MMLYKIEDKSVQNNIYKCSEKRNLIILYDQSMGKMRDKIYNDRS